MSFKISTAENLSRFLSSTRKTTTSTSSGRNLRLKPTKRTSQSIFQTALQAQGDINPHNDDLADIEVFSFHPFQSQFSAQLEDWRSVRAKLVSKETFGESSGLGESWVHEISAVERGCLLVCRREGLGFFHQSVILILSHGACDLERLNSKECI